MLLIHDFKDKLEYLAKCLSR